MLRWSGKVRSVLSLIKYFWSQFKLKAKEMSSYASVLQQFTKRGFKENSNVSEVNIKRTLDDICIKNLGIKDFSTEIADELWSEVEKNPNQTATVRNYINVLTRAQKILIENIQKCEAELGGVIIDPERKRELQESLMQFNDDLKLLTLPFKIPARPQSRYLGEIRGMNDQSRASNYMSGSGSSGRASGVFADFPSARENSISLKLTFLLTAILFVIEIILMFHKDHFYNALVYVSIFSIVLLGYFDKYYIKFILANILISIIFDLLWVFLQASPFWNPYPPTHHSTIQTPFLRFMYLFVIILMIAKGLLFILLFRYRNNDENIRKSVSIFGTNFYIDGSLKENNPISRILSGQGHLASRLRE